MIVLPEAGQSIVFFRRMKTMRGRRIRRKRRYMRMREDMLRGIDDIERLETFCGALILV